MSPKALKEILRADLNADTERGRLIRSAGVTAILKLGSIVLAFAASLLYARVLGPHDYGLYAYVLAWAAVLTIPAGLGIPPYLIREGSRAPGHLRSLCQWGDKRVLVSGFAAAILMSVAVFLPAAAGARWLFVIAAPLPVINVLSSIRRSLLQASGMIVRSQWPVLIFAPTVTLATLVLLWLWQGLLQPFEVVAAMTGAALLPLFINEVQLRRASPHSMQPDAVPARLGSALPFMWLGGLYLINNRADIIILGTLKGAHDAGIYTVAARAAELVTFFLAASNMVIAPRIARLYQEGRQALLQRLLSGAGRRVVALSTPIAIVFVFGAGRLLTYLYGPDYAEGAIALQILAGAQLLSVLLGPAGTVLNMVGKEKLCALGVGLGVVVNVSLNSVLIPAYGIGGAAIATGTSLVLWNSLLWYWVRQHLNLRPTGVGL